MSTAEIAPTVRTRTPRVEKVIGIALAVLSGIAMAVQGRINGQLGADLHDSLLAAVISFGGGLILLLLALPLIPTMRAGAGKVVRSVRSGGLRPWELLGGIGGATFVASQSITVPAVGVALFTVGVVAGQTLSSLAVDRAGLGPAGPQALSPARVIGALLTLAGVGWALSGGGLPAAGLWLLVLPLVAGALMAVQQAVNGKVGAVAGSPLAAALGNFTVGTTVLVLGWLVSLAVRGGPGPFPPNPLLYLGGLAGILFIASAALVVKWTGVLLLGLSAIAGQLIGSVLLDLVVPAHGAHLAASTLIGAGVTLVAVTIAAAGGRRVSE